MGGIKRIKSEKKKIEQGESIKAEERKISILAVLTFAVSIAAIPLFALSTYNFPDWAYIHHPLGLSSEFYNQLFKLCKILPLIPLGLGIAALINIALSHGKLKGKDYAISGLFLAIASYVVYLISLTIIFWSSFPPAS